MKCIQGWKFLSQVLVCSIFSIIQVKLPCNSNSGSFWRFCRSLFHKVCTAELSPHPFPVNASSSAIRTENILYELSRLWRWLKLALNGVVQKVSLAPTTAPPLRHPQHVTWRRSHILAFNVIWNFFRQYRDSCPIPVGWQTSWQLLNVCVALPSPLVMVSLFLISGTLVIFRLLVCSVI